MMLGLGAWLAIQGEVTPGIMIAASILLGRALAPIDQAVAQWPTFQRALHGRRSLAQFLRDTPEEPERTPLPSPKALLEAENLVVAAPGGEGACGARRVVPSRARPCRGDRGTFSLGQVDPGQGLGWGVPEPRTAARSARTDEHSRPHPGVPIFQEQAMKIAIDAANFSPAEANELRKAMATFRSRGTTARWRTRWSGAWWRGLRSGIRQTLF